jgi:thermostable 8-oxoguanine DNA glycosylase
MWSKLDYIHLNPTRAGIVEKASHYKYSSASNYVNNKGLAAIKIVDNPVIDVLKKASITKYNQY